MKPYIYIRTLKHAEHTVFCVQEGQKAYFDPLFNRMVALFKRAANKTLYPEQL